MRQQIKTWLLEHWTDDTSTEYMLEACVKHFATIYPTLSEEQLHDIMMDIIANDL